MDIAFLKDHWTNLTGNLPSIKSEFFLQLTILYGSPNRFYHNLDHIQHLLELSGEYYHLLDSPETIDFTIWYHDAIYKATKNNNEEKSAELAQKHLNAMQVNPTIIQNCYQLILATKNHQLPDELNSFDAKFLLDVDLSILASSKEIYLDYTQKIRKEYAMYPDFIYNRGRKQVLQHFLNTERIFKTDLFFELNEKKARQNLAFELNHLT